MTWDKEKQREYMKKYREENREKILQSQREYHRENREKDLAQRRERYILHGEQIRQRNREYYEKNKDKVLAQQKEWCKRNLEAIEAYKLARYIPMPDGQLCELCPMKDKRPATEKHHPDYSEPSIVIFCCGSCHSFVRKAPKAAPSD